MHDWATCEAEISLLSREKKAKCKHLPISQCCYTACRDPRRSERAQNARNTVIMQDNEEPGDQAAARGTTVITPQTTTPGISSSKSHMFTHGWVPFYQRYSVHRSHLELWHLHVSYAVSWVYWPHDSGHDSLSSTYSLIRCCFLPSPEQRVHTSCFATFCGCSAGLSGSFIWMPQHIW